MEYVYVYIPLAVNVLMAAESHALPKIRRTSRAIFDSGETEKANSILAEMRGLRAKLRMLGSSPYRRPKDGLE